MTFQEAQARFAGIIQSVNPGLAAPQLVQIQSQLYDLMNAMPNTAEFDPIVDAIKAVSPRLSGQVTQAVLNDLASRSSGLAVATDLLNQTAAQAGGDARVLTFDQPRLVAAALNRSVQAAQKLRDAASAGNVTAVADQAQALIVLLTQIQSTIKEG